MARYCFHLRDSTDELLDPEGLDFPDSDSMRAAVLAMVRDMMASDIREGIMDFRFRIDAEDGNGAIVYSLPFEHAVNIIPATVA